MEKTAYIEAGERMLEQTARLGEHGEVALCWLYSALHKFGAAGLGLEEVQAKVEAAAPHLVGLWKQKYT